MLDHTHDPDLTSWVPSANVVECDFPIQNLPFATFRRTAAETHPGVAIGDQILDLAEAFGIGSLQEIMGWPAERRRNLRHRISAFLATYIAGSERFLIAQEQVQLLLPCTIGNYTDFYASIHHATNVGMLFRPDQPLLPNYKWIPIAYHGRASSVVTSGSDIMRPRGQVKTSGFDEPQYTTTQRLDYEAEIGAFLGPGNEQGETIPIDTAEDHLFGVCLLNDWSARDIQSWEYQPLGPFLSKSFATSISPWIVTLDALEPFRCALPERPAGDPHPLEYLKDKRNRGAFLIRIEVWIRTTKMRDAVRLTHSDFSQMYWSLGQMITHHASNGCPLRAGDLIGSGTVSGPEPSNRGCLLELLGRNDLLHFPSGETRSYLEDGDRITLRGWCEAPGKRRIGLGYCSGTILPAHLS